jgi:predicted MPP superfamily phosphohydrolase
MPLKGRGRNYSRARGIAEQLLAWTYRGTWGRAVADAHPGSRDTVLRRLRVGLRGVPSAFRMNVGVMTDLHAGPTTSRRALARSFRLVREAQPDLVLFGGDYVFLDARYAYELVDEVSSLTPPHGKFAVMGNHDLWADDALIQRSLESAGARVLVNESVVAGDLKIVGIDDPWTGIVDVAKAFRGIDNSAPILVLCHAPEVLSALSDRSYDVLVCGHTHGGQVCRPPGVPIFVPGRIGRQYPGGRYDLENGAIAIVSRGVGTVEFPFRTWCSPEVILVELRAAPQSPRVHT